MRTFEQALSALEELMGFYHVGREAGDFENGIRIALQAILTSPSFVHRGGTALKFCWRICRAY